MWSVLDSNPAHKLFSRKPAILISLILEHPMIKRDKQLCYAAMSKDRLEKHRLGRKSSELKRSKVVA